MRRRFVCFSFIGFFALLPALCLAALEDERIELKAEKGLDRIELLTQELEMRSGGESDRPSLTLLSQPSEAQVFIDGTLAGTTPLTLTPEAGKTLWLAVAKKGYRDCRFTVRFHTGLKAKITVNLEELTGYLRVDPLPPGAFFVIDGETHSSALRLKVGEYRVLVRRFGYLDQEFLVDVVADEDRVLKADYQRAPFEITDLSFARSWANALNPGTLGLAELRLSVTAPGRATVEILDPQGRVLASHDFGDLDDWDASWTFRPADRTGAPWADGIYEARLSAVSDEVRVIKSAVVRVDRTRVLTFRSLWTGLGGVAWAPTAETQPSEAPQYSLLTLPYPGEDAVPLILGWRLGLGWGAETVVRLLTLVRTGDLKTGFGASFSYKHALWRSALLAGENLAAAWFLAEYVGQSTGLVKPYLFPLTASWPGFAAGLTLQQRWGPVALALTGLAGLSGWDRDAPLAAIAPRVSGGVKAALFADFGTVTGGLSASWVSGPFNGPESWFKDSVELAAETSFLVGESPFFIQVMAAARASSAGLANFRSGLGLGIIP